MSIARESKGTRTPSLSSADLHARLSRKLERCRMWLVAFLCGYRVPLIRSVKRVGGLPVQRQCQNLYRHGLGSLSRNERKRSKMTVVNAFEISIVTVIRTIPHSVRSNTAFRSKDSHGSFSKGREDRRAKVKMKQTRRYVLWEWQVENHLNRMIRTRSENAWLGGSFRC